ncbi:hypothetical protein ACFWN1_26485 [Streptomyces sp. NPDC058459]|uniref:hypothetical protein n=1 Tax=Streptomyces sp. NPDC058459 TaxID=3346508 RepID=UPI00364E4230
MRRILVPVAAALLATACAPGDRSDTPVDAAKPSGSSQAATGSSGAQGRKGPVPTPSGQLVTAIRAASLPYKPDDGMPALSDVKVIKTAADPCAIPADGSREEAQLIGAVYAGPTTVNVTFSFTNPCRVPLAYDYKITAAIGSAKGKQAGGGAEGTTPDLKPGQTVKQVVPVDVFGDLTPEQQQQLWVGCTGIGKQNAGR